MKTIALITILSMLSLSALADTYLCIGERATTISTIESEVVDAEANTTEAKWIVDENGLRNFGEDDPLIEKCMFSDVGVIYCDDMEFHLYQFYMTVGNLFRLVGVAYDEKKDDGTYYTYLVMGKCSALLGCTVWRGGST